MDFSLLETKVGIPPRPRMLIPRERLSSLLERDVRQHRLTLVVSPAGFGKTTLLADWASQTRLAVGWLTVERGFIDAAWFLRYLMAAWERFDPEIVRREVGLLLEPIEVDVERVLRAWVNDAAGLDHDVAIIIDEVHFIPAGPVQDALVFLIENMPEQVHFVLASRETPQLSLARYRGRAQMLELGSGDLAFTAEETGALIQQMSGQEFPAEEAEKLSDRLGGWAAALQLAALATGKSGNATGLSAASEGRRFVAEFVREEVLAALDPELRTWLLQVSVLDSCCGSLCDAVTGGDRGDEVLDELEMRQLFLSPIDQQREWFRFHPVFRDVLAHERDRDRNIDNSELHRRAARWYLERELPDPAFDHALEAGSGELVARIAEDYAVMKFFRGDFETVRRWIERVPPHWYDDQPELGLMKMAYCVFTGDFASAARTLDAVEAQLRRPGTDRADMKQARVAAARCAMACFANDIENAERFSEIALRGLGAENEVERANIYHALADTYRRNWRYAQAKRYYFEALSLVNNPTARGRAVHIFGALADLELEQGHLRNAERYWNKARQAVEDRAFWGLLPVPVIGWVYIRLAELHYERNDLSKAAEMLEAGSERARLGGDKRAMIAAGVIGSAIARARNDRAMEERSLEEASDALEGVEFQEWRCRLDRRVLELALHLGDSPIILQWTDDGSEGGVQGPFDDIHRLTIVRALGCQKKIEHQKRAERLARDIAAVAEQSGRTGVLIEALALQALARFEQGDVAGAMIPLERSLRLAEPEGYVRLFLDFGAPMARLLERAASRHVMPTMTTSLLKALRAGNNQGSIESVASLIDPLSARELEVLRLMAAGMTNREIGDRLFISPETVKKHAASLFAKLGCANRTEAAARARELDLLAG